MVKNTFSAACPNCGDALVVERLGCPACHARLEGRLALPRLARLSAEDREFIELFVLSAGSLKEVGRVLGVSYPTVRHRLDAVIAALKAVDEARQNARLAVIKRLEEKAISVEEAARLLAAL